MFTMPTLSSSITIIVIVILHCVSGSEYYLHQLDRAAYSGDVSKVIKLVELQLDWNRLYDDRKASFTAIHHALRGRHDSLATQSLQLLGNHEAVIDHLINNASLNPSLGCPVYHAVHYRNVRALELLLKALNKKDVLECLTAQDVNGETALHSAASSKASGFARFYAKLLTNGSQILQQSTKDVLELLDLGYIQKIHLVAHQLVNSLNKDDEGYVQVQISKRRTLSFSRFKNHDANNQKCHSFQLEYLSFEDLATVIGHRDITMILQKLKEEFRFDKILDKYQNTILHIAAGAGRLGLVRMLMKAGCAVAHYNMYGQTPMDMAINAGHKQTIMELMKSQFAVKTVSLKETDVCKSYHTDTFLNVVRTRMNVFPECKVFDFGMSQYSTSGWHSNYHSGKAKCDIEHVFDINVEDFQWHYYNRKQPMIFKSISLEWPAWKHWRRKEFMKRYGNILVQLSSIPYANLYGYHQNHFTDPITLSQYIESFNNLSSYRYPPYLFDAHILQQHSNLASDVPVPRMLSNFSISLRQFILGPKRSGSPPHFHRDALNGLVYGVKHWYLWPPAEAFFSIEHIQDWISQYNYYGNYSSAIECIQLPGDVLYIPENWGHAVVNEEHSIGFAYEFQ